MGPGMSEYQYYEFQAIDRCLTDSEKKATSYDKAVELLIDLRDLALRRNDNDFLLKLNNLKQRHSAKSSFIGRLRKIEPHV